MLAVGECILLFSALLHGVEFRVFAFSSDVVYRSVRVVEDIVHHKSAFASGSEVMSESYNEKSSEQDMAISATIVVFEEPSRSFTSPNQFTEETIGTYPHQPAPTQRKPWSWTTAIARAFTWKKPAMSKKTYLGDSAIITVTLFS